MKSHSETLMDEGEAIRKLKTLLTKIDRSGDAMMNSGGIKISKREVEKLLSLISIDVKSVLVSLGAPEEEATPVAEAAALADPRVRGSSR